MLVIGNGESRKDINIDLYRGRTIGCNAILRDYSVDYVICVDRRMVREAIERGFNSATHIFTRPDWIKEFKNEPRILKVPDLPYSGNDRWDEPFQWGSGPYAVLLGAMLAKEKIRLAKIAAKEKKQAASNRAYIEKYEKNV